MLGNLLYCQIIIPKLYDFSAKWQRLIAFLITLPSRQPLHGMQGCWEPGRSRVGGLEPFAEGMAGASRSHRALLVWGTQLWHPQAVSAPGSEVLKQSFLVLPKVGGTWGAEKGGARQGAPFALHEL